MFPLIVSRFLIRGVGGETDLYMWNVNISNQFWNQWRCFGLFYKNTDSHDLVQFVPG